jgi:hypothetical protein
MRFTPSIALLMPAALSATAVGAQEAEAQRDWAAPVSEPLGRESGGHLSS